MQCISHIKTALFFALVFLPFSVSAQEPLPAIHPEMSQGELSAIVAYIKAADDKPKALEKLLIKEYKAESREAAFAAYEACVSNAYHACESNSFTQHAGAEEVFCHLWENENALIRRVIRHYPLPSACNYPAIKRLETVAAYLAHLQKLTGGSISSRCGTIHKYKWRRINGILQSASYFPAQATGEKTKSKPVYEKCKTSKEYYCEGSPESSFGTGHWASQGMWQKEQYAELKRLRGIATEELAAYYERKELVSTPLKSAANYLKELEDAYIGHTGPTAVNGYESAYWTVEDLDEYLASGKLDHKEHAYYAKFTDASESAILSRFLYLAVVNNYSLDTIKKLIADGAPTTLAMQFARNNASSPLHFETPLMQAVKRPDVVKLLLDNGADPNAQNRFGKTPLMYALQEDEPESVSVLLEAKANPNLDTFDIDGTVGNRCAFALEAGSRTPLMYATWYASSADAIRQLLGAGADPTAKDSKGQAACDYIDKNAGIADAEEEQMMQLLCKSLNGD